MKKKRGLLLTAGVFVTFQEKREGGGGGEGVNEWRRFYVFYIIKSKSPSE